MIEGFKIAASRTSLEAAEIQLQLFSAAQSLGPGESCTYRPDSIGLDSKKECLAMKTWIGWERKRRMKMALVSEGMEGAFVVDSIDPLAGISIYLHKAEDGGYELDIRKPAGGRIVVRRRDGGVEENR